MAITFVDQGVYRVTAIGSFDAAVEERAVFQLRLDSGGPLSQQQGLQDIDDWLTLILNIVKAIQSTLLIWRGFAVEELDGNQNTGEIAFAAGSVVGADATQPTAPGVAFLQFMPTGEKNRQLRKYWGGVCEDCLDADGNIVAGCAATLATIDTLLLNAHNGTFGDWIYGHALAGIGASFVRPSAVNTSLNPSYQRRRRRGRGI
jgi:hypothetical protein